MLIIFRPQGKIEKLSFMVVRIVRGRGECSTGGWVRVVTGE